VARMGDGRDVYRFLAGSLEMRRSLEWPRRRWEDDINMDLREIGIDGANWILLAQNKVQWRVSVSTAMNFQVPWRKQANVWQAELLPAFQRISCTWNN
jgi:hypothetical protein